MITRGLLVVFVAVAAVAFALPTGAGPLPPFIEGEIRDELTGLGVDACVVVVSSTGVTVASTDSSGDGSFHVTVPPPVDPTGYRVGFYGTDSNDCQDTPRPTDPFPVWWENVAQTPFTPASPPSAALLVAAGSPPLEVCLGRTAPAKGPCPPPPDGHVTGTVRTNGDVPVFEACVVALVGRDQVFGSITDRQGRFDVGGLPTNQTFVMGAIPPFDTGQGPCVFDGPPPVPPPGALQPVWYDDIWVDLEAVSGDVGPIPFALAAGATPVTAPSAGIDFCLTAAPGGVVPRPSCAPALAPIAAQPTFTG